MHTRGRFALLGLVVFVAALVAPAADPPPLLKPVTPPGKQLRVRLAVTPGFPKTMQFQAQVPQAKKKTELMNVVVALDSLPGKSYISAKKLENWGYEVPKGTKEFLLPELLVRASQVAPNPDQQTGVDVLVRLANLRLTVIDAPAGSDGNIYLSDLMLCATALFQGGEKTMEPRLSFADKFLEITVPPAIVKRLGTNELAVPEVTVSSDTTLVPAFAPTISRAGQPSFSFASINGQDSYKTPDGRVIPVTVLVESGINMPSGVYMSIGLARGCKIDVDTMGGELSVGLVKSEVLSGKIKELRIAVNTGPGMKTVKDLVVKDLVVSVDKNLSEGYMMIGQKFMDTYIADAVYAADKDGWKLHGRIAPELLFDIKTRKKPEAKKQ